MKIAVTGRPGIGKTTLCMKVYRAVKDVEGFVTLEVREGGKRIGFKLHDLKSGEELWLAKVGEGYPRVGKYVVFVDSIDKFAERIKSYGKNVIIDEVGPMELKSKVFINSMYEIIESSRNVLVTVHYKSRHPLVERIKKEFKLYVIDERNRDKVAREIIEMWR